MYTYDVLPAVSCMPALLLHYGQNISQKVSSNFSIKFGFCAINTHQIDHTYLFLFLSLKIPKPVWAKPAS